MILKQIEKAPESVVPILRSLNQKATLQGLSKSETKHLVSRTLNLCRSPIEYNKWCGTALVRVITNNYSILANEGVELLGQLIKNLENYNNTIDIKIFNATVAAIDDLAAKIRGKPTLTREILTPKLPTILGLYLEKLHYNPKLVILSLKVYILNHSTTFRPFGNKLRTRLVTMMNQADFATYPKELQTAVFSIIAALPAIEKADPEDFWLQQVLGLVGEISSILHIYKEFLEDDGDVFRILDLLPTTSERVLGNLHIDVNEPKSLLRLSANVSILVGLLGAFVTTSTNFSVKVPLGRIIALCEAMCTINLKFQKFKIDVSDPVACDLLRVTISENHQSAIELLDALCATFRGNVLPHLSGILSFLETLLPYQHKKFDYAQLLAHERVYVALLECVESHLELVQHVHETNMLKFVDAALLLVEPRIEGQQPTKPVAQGPKIKNKKKNVSSVPLADLLSHQHLFVESIPVRTTTTVRRFLTAVVTKVMLPPTQHYKIMKYLIVETVNARHYNVEHAVPAELRELLVTAVLNPGFEKVSLLPIVSSLLPRDPLLSVFNNPRFPPLPVILKNVEEEEEEDEDEDEEMMDEVEEKEEVVEMKEKETVSDGIKEEVKEVYVKEAPVVKESQVVKEAPVVKEQVVKEQVVKEAPAVKEAPILKETPTVKEGPVESTPKHDANNAKVQIPTKNAREEEDMEDLKRRKIESTGNNDDNDDESDFEMPEIDVGSDDE